MCRASLDCRPETTAVDISRKFAFASHSLRVGLQVSGSVKFPLLVSQDIDQWNKVTELLGTPSESFLNQLQPSVSTDTAAFSSFKQMTSTSIPQEFVAGINGISLFV